MIALIGFVLGFLFCIPVAYVGPTMPQSAMFSLLAAPVGLLLFLVVLNALLRKVSGRAALTQGDLILIYAITTVAAATGGRFRRWIVTGAWILFLLGLASSRAGSGSRGEIAMAALGFIAGIMALTALLQRNKAQLRERVLAARPAHHQDLRVPALLGRVAQDFIQRWPVNKALEQEGQVIGLVNPVKRDDMRVNQPLQRIRFPLKPGDECRVDRLVASGLRAGLPMARRGRGRVRGAVPRDQSTRLRPGHGRSGPPPPRAFRSHRPCGPFADRIPPHPVP